MAHTLWHTRFIYFQLALNLTNHIFTDCSQVNNHMSNVGFWEITHPAVVYMRVRSSW